MSLCHVKDHNNEPMFTCLNYHCYDVVMKSTTLANVECMCDKEDCPARTYLRCASCLFGQYDGESNDYVCELEQ